MSHFSALAFGVALYSSIMAVIWPPPEDGHGPSLGAIAWAWSATVALIVALGSL